MKTNNKNTAVVSNIKLFGNIRVLVISALFIAMSIIFGKYLAINPSQFVRLSFENLTLLMAGIFFGPFVGAAVGAGADIIGCFIVGYAINPYITIGAASIGFISGLVAMFIPKDKILTRIIASVAPAHIIGSMIIKTIGFHVVWGYPLLETFMWRVLTYIGIGILEGSIIYMLLKNKAFSAQLERMCKK